MSSSVFRAVRLYALFHFQFAQIGHKGNNLIIGIAEGEFLKPFMRSSFGDAALRINIV